jgi:hypothetical protein
MKLPPISKITVAEFKVRFGKGKVIRCKKFNRRDCWKRKNIENWYDSVMKGWDINPLIFVEINSCISWAIANGLDEDRQYFQDYKDEGYEFITLEGGNRTGATELMFDAKPNYRDKELYIAIIENVSREEMHEGYVRLAHGVSPNPQEKRTGIYGSVSDLVRNTTENLEAVWSVVKKVKHERMEDDEFVAMILNYSLNKSFGPSITGKITKDEVLDSMYRTKRIDDAPFKHIVNNLKLIFEEIQLHPEISKGLPKTVIYLLVILIQLIKENNFKIQNYQAFVSNWYDYYNKRMRDKTVLFERGPAKFQCTFKHLISGLILDPKVQLQKFTDIVKTDFIKYLIKHDAIVPYNTVEFTSRNREEWIDTNKYTKEDDKDYVTVRTNTPDLFLLGGNVPEFTEITLTEACNGFKYELDHIIPKSKGGETALTNAELTSKIYNRKKTDKLLIKNK